MQHVRVLVEHHDHLPDNIPAVWTLKDDAHGAVMHLDLLRGLPQEVADHFRAMAVRDCLPDVDWDNFTVGVTAGGATLFLSIA